MTFQDCTLDWSMRFANVPFGTMHKTLFNIKVALMDEFQKSKSESQCITKIKEIKKLTIDLTKKIPR